MTTWEEVKQMLATYGYSEQQKKEFFIKMNGVLEGDTYEKDGKVRITPSLDMKFTVTEEHVLKEVAAAYMAMKKMGLKLPSVNFWLQEDTTPQCYRIRVDACFEYVCEV